MAHPFKELGISDAMVRGLEELGISSPTEVQRQVIPFLLEDGGDLIAQAQTGTGKTAAFGLPLLARIDPGTSAVQGLVVAPTRELAKQIGKQLFRFTKYTEKMFVEVASGGDDIGRQRAALRRPTHVVVATPGRLVELHQSRALRLDAVRHLVLDEADEMLSMGFRDELGQIFELTGNRRSTWLFSATFPEGISRLTRRHMAPQARSVKIDREHVVNRDITHRFAVVPRAQKSDYISDFLRRQTHQRGLIFCRTKAGAIGLGRQLRELGLPVDVLQGDLSQKERDKVLRAFKNGRVQFLIATDVVARGIDVEGLAFVLHHQLPDQTEYYTHRSGRTARAGRTGDSIALVDPKEKKRLHAIAKELGLTFKEID